MIHPPPVDPWTCRFALDPPASVRFVSAAGGSVVAAGEGTLHLLRPGSRRLRSAELPPDVDAVAVAAEPWSPYRVAIASPASVGIYSGHRPHELSVGVRHESRKYHATHLAWARLGGVTQLLFRQATGEVCQLEPETGATATITCPPMTAIAADVEGVVTMLNLAPVAPANVGDAWILPLGAKQWDVRWVDCGPDDRRTTWTNHVAVLGGAVAYSVVPGDTITYSGGVQVSWEGDEENDRNTFDLPPGVMRGPIAFQDPRAMFAAYNVEGQVNVLRWVRDGSFTRIARFGLGEDWEGTPATVTGLAWDQERRALWAASPELGLIEIQEPHGAGGVN